MTTFDETGIFELAEQDADSPAPARPLRVATVLLLAAALVAAGVGWLWLARGQEAAAVDTMTVQRLARPAVPADALDPALVDETGIDPTSSRLVAQDATGSWFAALRWGGELCLISVPTGDVAGAVCAAASPTAVVGLTAEDGSRIRLGADGAPAPDTAEGWRSAGDNVWVLAAPDGD